MRERSGRPASRGAEAALAGVAALLLAVLGLGALGVDPRLPVASLDRVLDRARSQTQPGTGPADATREGRSSEAAAVDRSHALEKLLRQRSAAVLRRDARAWLATLDRRTPAFVRRQQRFFTDVTRLRPTKWTYRLEGLGELPAARRRALPASARLLDVTLSYRLGADTRDVQRAQHLTVVPRGGRWLVLGDQDGGGEKDLWDLGPVATVRGARTLVVGTAGQAATLRRIAADGDAAARRVDSVWGSRWPRRVTILVPGSLKQMATLLARSSAKGLDQVAAVTSGELQRGGGAPSGVADRVVLNPSAFVEFSQLGRRVVLTHEFTHVATRASAVVAPPLWVEEGFADYVGYLRSDLPRTVVAADLLAQVRAGKVPAHLPSEDDFDPARHGIAPAYAGAWLAMELVAAAGDGGPRSVVAFYRTAAGLPATPGSAAPGPAASGGRAAQAQALRDAFSSVVGSSQSRFEARWRAYLRRLASTRR